MSDDEDVFVSEPANMAWLFTFADLISLLITFFVLLFSMKEVDESQWDVLSGSLRGVFSEEEAPVVFVHPSEFQTADTLSSFPADSLPYLENLLHKEFDKEDILKEVEMEYDPVQDILKVDLPSALLFESGSNTMTRKGKRAIIKLSDKLRHWDNRMQVSGHTDPGMVVDTGSMPTNWELGMLRAIAVARIMYERGVEQRVAAFSYGDSRFEKLGIYMAPEERLAKARRVEIWIYGDQSE